MTIIKIYLIGIFIAWLLIEFDEAPILPDNF